MYEFEEFHFLVGVGVNSEQVPENVVELSLGGLVQNFNHEGLQLGFVQESLGSLVVFIEVDLEFVPDGLDESVLFIGDALRMLGSAVFSRFFRLRFSPEVKVVAEILPDKINKLLEGDESIVVGVKFLEDEDEVIPARFVLDEVASLSDEGDKLIEGDPFGFPDLAVGGFVSPVEEDLDEVDREDDGDQLVEFDVVFSFLEEGEVVVDDVFYFVGIEGEHFLKDLSDFVDLEHLVFICIVSEEYYPQLIDYDSDESVPGVEVFVGQHELLKVGERFLDWLQFDWFLGHGRAGSEVVPQEEEVDHVGDPAVMVQINF